MKKLETVLGYELERLIGEEELKSLARCCCRPEEQKGDRKGMAGSLARMFVSKLEEYTKAVSIA